MLYLLSRNWWVFAVRGVAAIVFGVLAFVWPGVTVVVLVALFGAYALVDGVSLLVSLVRGERDTRRHGWSVAVMGLLGVAAGVITFLWPGITAVTLVFIVGFWSIALGVFQIVAAIRLRREIEGELWMGIGGVLAILFGLYVLLFPGAGLLSLVWLVGFWAVLFGLSNLVLAWRLRSIHQGGSLGAPGRA